MATVKISALTAATSAGMSDVLPVVQGGTTLKTSRSVLLAGAVYAHGTTGGSVELDLADGDVQTITLNAETTFSFANWAASGCPSLALRITNGGDYTINWPAACRFPGGIAPELTTGGTDWLILLTADGGTNVDVALSMEDVQ